MGPCRHRGIHYKLITDANHLLVHVEFTYVVQWNRIDGATNYYSITNTFVNSSK